MISQAIMREQIRKLEECSSHEDKLYKILEVYLELFPVKNAFLFSYSPLSFLGGGIISLASSGLVNISEARDDVRSLPIISSAIRERKAKYCSGIGFLKALSLNNKYIIPSNVNSMVVVPICLGSAVIGYICTLLLLKGEGESLFDEKMLSSLTLYGKLIGKFLEKSSDTDDSKILSKRELEVMRRISWGESTKEMADAMKISDLTVKQYVKSALKKLGVQNRSHAVGELLRKGIIS